MPYKVKDNRAKRGGAPALVLYSFLCEPCKEWFEALSYHSSAIGAVLPARHRCGEMADQRIRPGSRMAIRGGESNSIPREIRKVWQNYWNLNDQQMKHVTRSDIDRDMKRRGLHFADASWDDNRHGSKRASGQAAELPPNTEDPNEVRDWNAKRYGRETVVETEQLIRSEFDNGIAAQARGEEYNPLPKAETTDVHRTPHRIDLEKTVKDLSAAPVTDEARRKELSGRLITAGKKAE